MKTILAILCGLLLAGCSSDTNVASQTTGSTNAEATKPATTPESSTPKSTTAETPAADSTASTDDPSKRMPKNGEEVAVLDTNLGKIIVMFFPDKAPKTVENFKKLVKKGFYDGTKFHRVIPGFMIQGGDPNSKNADRSDDGSGGPGYSVDAEFNDVHHGPGILSMARSSDPNSAGSQFFIVVADANHLDGQYTAFGRAVEGMDIVDKIVNLKRDERDNPLPENPAIIKSAKLTTWPVK